MPLFLNPSSDLHLFSGGQAMELRLLGFEDGLPWSDLATHPNFVGVVGAHADGADVVQASQTPTGVRFLPRTPAVVGTGFYHVITSLNLPAPVGVVQLRGLVRVTVHPGIQSFWAGNNRVTLFQGESNYVLTVYGEFATGVADITGHPYIQYDPADPAIATVSPDGRVTGVSQGQTTVEVRINNVAPIPPVPVEVLGRVADHRPTIFRIKPGSSRNPVFVLAEGYGDEARFRSHVRRLCDRWFRSATQNPFDALADSFDVWGVFDPTRETRITVGSPVSAARPGEPVSRQPLPADLRLAQARDSRFGLMYGDRLGSPDTTPHTPTIRPALASWLTSIANPRSVGVDYRRIPATPVDPHAAFGDCLSRYLQAAGLPGAGAANARALFLVDDELRGGAVLGVTGAGAPPSQLAVAAVIQSGNRFSHVAPGGQPPRVDRDPGAAPPRFEREIATSIVVHEVGHSFVLGDEYENSNGIAARNQLPAAQPELVERFENLHAHTGLQDASEPGGVDPSGIKWNHLRIKKISHVKSLARRPNNQIAVEVSRKQRRRWRKGDRAYLGASARNNLSSRQEVAGLEADAVLLQPDANLNLDDYPAGSFLIGPKQKGDDDLFLVDPAVLEHVRLNGPFPRSLPNCAQASAAKQLPPKGIANFSQPSSRWRVVGLYEGGGGFNCGAHRPSGQCRMRDSFDEAQQKHIAFCFVCRYLIVDQVDPLEHDTLDACYYPEDC